jgi:hypothetical protein
MCPGSDRRSLVRWHSGNRQDGLGHRRLGLPRQDEAWSLRDVPVLDLVGPPTPINVPDPRKDGFGFRGLDRVRPLSRESGTSTHTPSIHRTGTQGIASTTDREASWAKRLPSTRRSSQDIPCEFARCAGRRRSCRPEDHAKIRTGATQLGSAPYVLAGGVGRVDPQRPGARTLSSRQMSKLPIVRKQGYVARLGHVVLGAVDAHGDGRRVLAATLSAHDPAAIREHGSAGLDEHGGPLAESVSIVSPG